ncbi:hypothetical protein ACFLYD_03800 [Chloroflexota bacterium]
MKIGLLWFDDDPQRGLEDKVGRAAQRYREKYGRWPNTCYVHPEVVADHLVQELRVAGGSRNHRRTIRIVSAQNILLHHYWLGENTKRMPAKQRRAAA